MMMKKSEREYGTSGYFGQFGGMFVPEILMHALKELEESYLKYRDDKAFQRRAFRIS